MMMSEFVCSATVPLNSAFVLVREMCVVYCNTARLMFIEN